MGEDAAVVCRAGAVPKEAFVGFFEFCEFRFGEAVGFAFAGDAEDVFEAEADAVGGAGGLDEVVGQGFVF